MSLAGADGSFQKDVAHSESPSRSRLESVIVPTARTNEDAAHELETSEAWEGPFAPTSCLKSVMVFEPAVVVPMEVPAGLVTEQLEQPVEKAEEGVLNVEH